MVMKIKTFRKKIKNRIKMKTKIIITVGLIFSLAGCVQNNDLPEEAISFRKVVKTKSIKTYSESALALRRWMIKNDPHYPIFHFTAPESWISDPNGLIYHDGKYHFFYQFLPVVEKGKGSWERSWGHAVSTDFFHRPAWPWLLPLIRGESVAFDNRHACPVP